MPTFRESWLPDLPSKDSTNEIQETIALQGVAVEHGKIWDAATEWGAFVSPFLYAFYASIFWGEQHSRCRFCRAKALIFAAIDPERNGSATKVLLS